jgi:TRAP-type C4-dicarboxylate transport system permease small subunit
LSPAQSASGEAGGALGRVDRLYAWVENGLNFIGAGVIFALMLFVCAEVFARTALNKSIFGFIDVVQLSMAAFAFLGAAYCQRLGGHIRMDLAVSQLRGRWLWSTELISTFVAMIVIALLIKGSWDHFLRAYQIGDTTIDAEVVTWPSKLLAPIGLSFLWLRLLLNLVGYLRLLWRPEAEPVAVPPPPGSHHVSAEVDTPEL